MAEKGNFSPEQSNYSGGQWTRDAHGRTDDPRYKTALAVYQNAMPTEQGAFRRRQGTQGIIPTRNRGYAKLLPFEVPGSLPYIMEFTNNCLRFFFGTSPIFKDFQHVASITGVTGSGLTVVVGSDPSWVAGDDVMFWFPPDMTVDDEHGFRNRVLQCLTGTSGTTIQLGDEVGIKDVTTAPTFNEFMQLWRILALTTSIPTAALRDLRAVQMTDGTVVLGKTIWPNLVKMVTAPSGFTEPTFSTGNAPVKDGPYADMQPGGGAVSGFSGSITFTPSDGSTFAADDVGKHIRLFSEPPAWAVGTTYASGALVTYNSAYYRSTQGSNVGHTPDAPVLVSGVMTLFWAPVLNVQRWVWGGISSQTGTACVIALGPDISTVNGVQVGAAAVIPSGNGSLITKWQKGLWSSALGHPICGTFHEGRLFLSGPIGNRFDISVSDQPFVFSPTDQYGNVNDNSAISYTLNSSTVIHWMKPDDRGVVCGTKHGMELISAGTDAEALTPTNIKARRVSEDKAAFIEPVRAGSSFVFAQRYRKHVLEYLVDSFSGRFGGKPLNDFAPEMTAGLVQELAFTEEPMPTIWARNGDGSLVADTYRRISRFITEAPLFNAWHNHPVGDGRIVEALCGTASGGGADFCAPLTDATAAPKDTEPSADRLYLVTNDAPVLGGDTLDNRMVEVMMPLAIGTEDFSLGWYVDQSPGAGKHMIAHSALIQDHVCAPMGGLKGGDHHTTEPPDKGGRGTRNPGGHIDNRGGDRHDLVTLAQNSVFFNGYTSCYGLPPMADATSFLLSVWLNPDADAKGRSHGSSNSALYSAGSLLAGNSIFIGNWTSSTIIPQVAPIDKWTFGVSLFPFDGAIMGHAAVDWLDQGGNIVAHAGDVIYYNLKKGIPAVGSKRTGGAAVYRVGALYPTAATDFTATAFNPLTFGNGGGYFPDVDQDHPAQDPSAAFNEGWFHLMISGRVIAHNNIADPNFDFTYIQVQVYINDTYVYDSVTEGDAPVMGTTGHPEQRPLLFPFGDLVKWAVGGCSPGNAGGIANTATPDGGALDTTGYVGGMTEFWFAAGQWLDLNDIANRELFHCSDLAQLTWCPVSLGAQGKAPTGTKPTLYLTGNPKKFFLNRAKKNAPLAVYNNYPDVKHQVHNAFDPPELDPWLGPAPT